MKGHFHSVVARTIILALISNPKKCKMDYQYLSFYGISKSRLW